MKKVSIVIFILAIGAFAKGQDYGTSIKLPVAFTQYYMTPHLVNPALTGFEDVHRLTLNYRSHWSEFPGAPRSFAGSYNGPAAEKVGLGALIFAESYGAENRFRGQLSYAYKFGSNDYNMALGLSTDFTQLSLDSDVFENPEDVNDPLLQDGSRQYIGASVGFYSAYKKSFYFGLSLPHLVFSRIDDGNGDDESSFNYIATLGAWLDVPNYNFIFEPSIYLKKVGNVPLHLDINLVGKFLDERLYGGLTYSAGAGNRAGFLIGVKINSFRFLYSYDVSFQDFQEYNNGSHEVTLNFDLFSKLRAAQKASMDK